MAKITVKLKDTTAWFSSPKVAKDRISEIDEIIADYGARVARLRDEQRAIQKELKSRP